MSGVSQQRGGVAGLPYLGSFTWANRPSVPDYACSAFISDLGPNGTLIYGNTVKWVIPPVTLLQGGVPMYVPPDGTIGDNGALTLGTAFLHTFSSGVYLYFPADKIAAGVAAGLYYCVMSSTTVGTIYNNTYTSGIPVIPASPTAFSTTGPGAYTQTINADITMLSVTLPGGLMGKNGVLRARTLFGNSSSASNKLGSFKLGSSVVISPGLLTTTTVIDITRLCNNAGVENRQYLVNTTPIIGTGTGGSGFSEISEDTSADKTITAICKIPNGISFMGVLDYFVECIPS